MSDEYLIQWLAAHMGQLEERLSAAHAELGRRIDDLAASHDALTGAILARLDAHEEYHRSHEHRWGLIKLASRHPFRLAALACAGALVFSTLDGNARAWIETILRKTAEILEAL